MRFDFPLPSQAATQRVARVFAAFLMPGDCLLLSGPVGAGKSLFARTIIQDMQARAGQPVEDVPSPSFTLVQTYRAGDVEIWHVDLYRLGDPGEIAELGLEEAFPDAVTIVEWPALLGNSVPSRHLSLELQPDEADPDMRHALIETHGPGWDWLSSLAVQA